MSNTIQQRPVPEAQSAVSDRDLRRWEVAPRRLVDLLNRYRYLVLVLFSLSYFVTTCYRASRKSFWSDELYTLYVSRLPDFGSIWSAVTHGVDFNPPLLYALTRFAEAGFGEGPIVTRWPAIVGFWVFCLCLYRFTSAKASPLAGFVSMLVPMVTLAYHYAYEARPHGIVLGWVGVALVCWQQATHERRSVWFLLGFGSALACAILTHSYGVMVFLPFVLGESVRTLRLRRVDRPLWATIALASTAALVSVPLLRAVRMNVGTALAGVASLSVFAESYRVHFGPAAGVLAGAVALLSIARVSRLQITPEPNTTHRREPEEIVTLLAFLALPVFGFIAARLTGAPVMDRYSVSCVAGVACLLGIATAKRPEVGLGVLVLLCSQIGLDFRGFKQSSDLLEPSTVVFAAATPLRISTTKPVFAETYNWLDSLPNKDLPIVLLDPWEFVPIAFYSPPRLAARFVYLSWPDYNGENYKKLQKYYKAAGTVVERSEFLRVHDSFLIYGGPRSSWQVDFFIQDGADVSVIKVSADHFLMSVTYKRSK